MKNPAKVKFTCSGIAPLRGLEFCEMNECVAVREFRIFILREVEGEEFLQNCRIYVVRKGNVDRRSKPFTLIDAENRRHIINADNRKRGNVRESVKTLIDANAALVDLDGCGRCGIVVDHDVCSRKQE